MHDHFTFSSLIYGACAGQRIAMVEFLEECRPKLFQLAGTNVFMKV